MVSLDEFYVITLFFLHENQCGDLCELHNFPRCIIVFPQMSQFSDPKGRRFESCQPHQEQHPSGVLLFFVCMKFYGRLRELIRTAAQVPAACGGAPWQTTCPAVRIGFSAITLVCTLFFCTFLAYPLSLPQFKARKAIGVFVLLPMFLSGGMIPEFTTISRYGLLDTVWALALPASASTLYVILMRGNFSQISGELREAALIDGASEFQIFYRIVLPLSKVILVIISLYAIVDSWNNFTCYAFSQPVTRGLGSPKNVRVDVHTLCLQNLPGWKRSLSTGFPRVIARLRPSGFQ